MVVEQEAKKKRTAERQITKDEEDSGNEGDEDQAGQGQGTWERASEEEMKKRRIVRAKRRGAVAPVPEEKLKTLTESEKEKDPFLSAQKIAGTDTQAKVATPPKVPLNPFAGISFTKPPTTTTTTTSPTVTPSGFTFGGAVSGSGGGFGAFNKQPPAAMKTGGENKDKDKKDPPLVVTPPATMTTSSSGGGLGGFSGGSIASGSLGMGGGGFGGFGSVKGGFGSVGGGFGSLSKNTDDPNSNNKANKPASEVNPFRFGSAATTTGGDASSAPSVAVAIGGDKDEAKAKGKFSSLKERESLTGEESEESVFTASGVLYEYGGQEGEQKSWREKGRGQINLNTDNISKKARLVMRTSGSKRLILNANLWPEMAITRMAGSNGITFACVNAAKAPKGEPEAKATTEEEEEKNNADDAAAAGGKDAKGSANANASTPSTYALRMPKSVNIADLIELINKTNK
jgi:hypothetical protein